MPHAHRPPRVAVQWRLLHRYEGREGEGKGVGQANIASRWWGGRWPHRSPRAAVRLPLVRRYDGRGEKG